MSSNDINKATKEHIGNSGQKIEQPRSSEDVKPTVHDFVNPGPQIPIHGELPPKASRDEINARMAELNKK